MTLTGYEMLKDPMGASGEDNNNVNDLDSKTEATTPNVKKRLGLVFIGSSSRVLLQLKISLSFSDILSNYTKITAFYFRKQ